LNLRERLGNLTLKKFDRARIHVLQEAANGGANISFFEIKAGFPVGYRVQLVNVEDSREKVVLYLADLTRDMTCTDCVENHSTGRRLRHLGRLNDYLGGYKGKISLRDLLALRGTITQIMVSRAEKNELF